MRTIGLTVFLALTACQGPPTAQDAMPRGSPPLRVGSTVSGTIQMHQRPILLPLGQWTVMRDDRKEVDGVVSISLVTKLRDRMTALDFKSTPAIVFTMDPKQPGVPQTTAHRVAVGFKTVCPPLSATILVSESLPSGINSGGNDCLVIATKVVGSEADALRALLLKAGIAVSPLQLGVVFGASEANLNVEVRASLDPAVAGIDDGTASGWTPAAIEADPKKRSLVARATEWAKAWRLAIKASRAGNPASSVLPYP